MGPSGPHRCLPSVGVPQVVLHAWVCGPLPAGSWPAVADARPLGDVGWTGRACLTRAVPGCLGAQLVPGLLEGVPPAGLCLSGRLWELDAFGHLPCSCPSPDCFCEEPILKRTLFLKVLGLQKNCDDSVESPQVPHTQLSLLPMPSAWDIGCD